MIEDDPIIEYASEKTCKKSLPEMEALVQFHLTAKLIPGPYMIDTLCGDQLDLKNYEIYLNLLAEQMRVQLEHKKTPGCVKHPAHRRHFFITRCSKNSDH